MQKASTCQMSLIGDGRFERPARRYNPGITADGIFTLRSDEIAVPAKNQGSCDIGGLQEPWSRTTGSE